MVTLATRFCVFTITAMPSVAISVVTSSPVLFSASVRSRLEVAISAVPLSTLSMPADEPKPLTSTWIPVCSVNCSAAISAMGMTVVEPATVSSPTEAPEPAHPVLPRSTAKATRTLSNPGTKAWRAPSRQRRRDGRTDPALSDRRKTGLCEPVWKSRCCVCCTA